MAYIKTNWQDQKVERPHTYESNTNADGTITLIDSFGNVEQMGTPVNAQNLNKIEDGIAGVAIRLHNMNEIFAKDEWVKDGKTLYISLKPQNKGHKTNETEWWKKLELGGGGMPVGTIFPHTASISHIPENSVPCDGMEYSKDQFKALYNDFLVLKRLETCTYEQYQQEITTNGACAKFGIDTANGKFKVPLIPDGYYIKKGQGTANKAGLPNITGLLNDISMGGVSVEGAFKYSSNSTHKPNSDRAVTGGISLDASLSDPIYGASDTVETNAVSYRYFVVVATGSIKQSEMDWSAWASSLQGKANTDLANTTPKLDNSFMSKLMPDYNAEVIIASGSNAKDKTFNAVSTGVVNYCTLTYGDANNASIMVNGKVVDEMDYNSSVGGGFFTLKAIVNKNDVIRCKTDEINNFRKVYIKFYPLKGAN